MNTPHTHVWCEQCQRIQPLVLDDIQMDDATAQYTSASDLLCAVCSFAIATLYTVKPEMVEVMGRPPF